MKRCAVALVAVLCVTGCATSRSLPDGRVDATAPRPVGAQDPAAIPTSAAVPPGSCDPRASLRPSGALPTPGRMPADSTMAQIARRGRLVVGVDQNNYRFGYRDPGTGDLVGFEIDLAHEIARAIFGDPGKVLFRAVRTAEREQAVQTGAVDIVIRSMTMNCDRWQRVSFSTEYFSAGQAILVAKGSPIKGLRDLTGRKVCAATGSTSIRNIAAKAPQALPVSAADALDCLVMLQQNQVAAVSTDDAILAGFAAQDPGTTVLPERFTEEPYGMAMQKESPDLVRFVNGVLERLRADGTWTRLYNKWLTALGSTPQPPAARYRD
ncbi:amino acid ABC transporter substrate-binding protein, PAAT family [Micromonospora rhizosphaerae]|uniref:Amino acid ABC transporter substrate-binding protein, PAAT family n=1 Tax=Micromonospora rhizosphaerae TaxID=568872 RepID=A0A1C6SQ16_9ACTN|nr:glutamate ABC transporter substrate-binding protein [Micromonospora rhizosphaerae]SCL31620.1 amino acid ABC transporter substrate-binding protein, PAAT family [Micromonospora rhizosphaerae]